MKNFPFQHEGKTYWYSRAIVCVSGVFCKDENNLLYVLANKRGTATEKEQYKWNLPVGFLEFDERCQECAVREVYEETGVQLKPNQMKLISINSVPDGETQDVGFRYVTLLPGVIKDYPLSLDHMEENEVEKAKWINVNELDNYNWAWNHRELIDKFLQSLN